MKASRGTDEGSTSTQPTTVTPTVVEPPADATPEGKQKKQKLEKGQKTLFSWQGAERQRILKAELRAQREAALRDEDYTVEVLPVLKLPSESQVEEEVRHCKHQCPKCPRTFRSYMAMKNHMMWQHDENVADKIFMPPPPRNLPNVACELSVEGETVQVCLRIGGLTDKEMLAAVAAGNAANDERDAKRLAEFTARKIAREKAGLQPGGEDDSEYRKGSSRRGSYTAKQKLKQVEVFDALRDDDTIKNIMKAFEADTRTTAPYTTVLKWTKPIERARISRAASKEHRQSLLRIDKNPSSRKKGKYPEMEKELYRRFKEKRARGRKVSARWVSATGRQVMAQLHPGVHFQGTYNWRRRWARRYNINMNRRKSNVKNKTFADSEPVLLRYFRGLRRRLQLDADGVVQEPEEGEEPEPEDINPQPEGDGVGEHCATGDNVLDSTDDEDDEAQLFTFESALGNGMRVSESPPSEEQLEFKHAAAKELKDKLILYNWSGLGWCAGHIRRPSGDKSKLVKVDGERRPANFIIGYDDGEGPHCLTLAKYGQGPLRQGERWVLIEPVEDSGS